MEMSTPPPATQQSPAAVKQLSFEMGALRDMIEGLLETKFEKFTDLFQQVLEAKNEANAAKKEAAGAKAEAAAAMARAVKAEADAHAAKLEAAQAMAEAERLRAKCTVSFEGVHKRLSEVEGAMNSQSATIIEKSVAELKASPSWANVVRGGSSPSQQRSTQPAVEQQFFMVGLEDIEGKNQLEVASLVKETLDNIGVQVSELHDVLLLKPRPGAAAGAPRRVKFTVMTAMQARLIRANRKQLREVAAHISIRDVLSPEEQAVQNSLWPQFVEARKAGKRAYFQRGQLYVDGRAVEAPASA